MVVISGTAEVFCLLISEKKPKENQNKTKTSYFLWIAYTMMEMSELFFKGRKGLFQKDFDDNNHLFLTFPFRILEF